MQNTQQSGKNKKGLNLFGEGNIEAMGKGNSL